MKSKARNGLAWIGGLTVFGTAGSSDYFSMVLGEAEPWWLWPLMGAGFLLMLPKLVSLGRAEEREDPRRLGVIRYVNGHWVPIREED